MYVFYVITKLFEKQTCVKMLIIFISENHKILKMHLYIRSRRCRLNCNRS